MILTIKAFTITHPTEEYIISEGGIRGYFVEHSPEKQVTTINKNDDMLLWDVEQVTSVVTTANLPPGTYDVRIFANNNHLMSVEVEVE